MKRIFIAAVALASACFGKEYEPNELEISMHRMELFKHARNYIEETFNLQVFDEPKFNPVRFNSQGVWGNFEARIKELGDDRYEVEGWFTAAGHDKDRVPWTVHLRYRLLDPELWRYRKVGDDIVNEPEFLGWKLGDYYSVGYEAPYDEHFIARVFGDQGRR